jgi:hypothetical protein
MSKMKNILHVLDTIATISKESSDVVHEFAPDIPAPLPVTPSSNSCPLIHLTGPNGENLQELLRKNIEEAVQALFREVKRQGELEEGSS